MIGHGRIVDEIHALHAAGLPAAAALDAACWAAREWLGADGIGGRCQRRRRAVRGRTRGSSPATLRDLKHIVLRGSSLR